MVTPRRRASILAPLIALMAGSLTAPIIANGQSCPPNLVCSPRMHQLVAQGVEQSESFRVLVLTLGSHPRVGLKLGLLRQEPGKHAQSSFQIKVTYAEVNGREIRQVDHVSGNIAVRPFAYARDQIGDIAHELAHVLQLLEGVHPGDLDSPRCWAKAYKNKVVGELEAHDRFARKASAPLAEETSAVAASLHARPFLCSAPF